jgi:hypothetical protein
MNLTASEIILLTLVVLAMCATFLMSDVIRNSAQCYCADQETLRLQMQIDVSNAQMKAMMRPPSPEPLSPPARPPEADTPHVQSNLDSRFSL